MMAPLFSAVSRRWALLFACLGALPVFASMSELRISGLEGTAKVQRPSKRTWDDLKRGDRVNDNDIVETFFQTKLVLEHAAGDMVIVGSNTKILFNLTPREGGQGAEINSTIFGGGMFVKAAGLSRFGIFTSHGVAKIDSGAISAVVEAKSGVTGFQMLGGKSDVRNIAQQDQRQLTVGQTTIIRPGKAPTAPLYITTRHVAVLKHFFGGDYIQRELQTARITPTDDKSGERVTLGSAMAYQRNSGDEGMHQSLFNLDKIYGSITADQRRRYLDYDAIAMPDRIFATRAELGLHSATALGAAGVYPRIMLTPSLRISPRIDVGLRLPMNRTVDGWGPALGGIQGILDKIDHLSIALPGDSSYVRLRALTDLTLGAGLLVKHFNAVNDYTCLTPLGLHSAVHRDMIHVTAFMADLATLHCGGVHASVTPGATMLGGGVYYDLGTDLPPLPAKQQRLRPQPQPTVTTVRDPGSQTARSLFYELNAGFDIFNQPSGRFGLMLQYAQKFSNGKNDGYLVDVPGATVEWSHFKAGASVHIEKRHLSGPYFHSFYATNRLRLNTAAPGQSVMWSQSDYLSSWRVASGFTLNAATTILKGFEFTASYRQDFGTRYPFTQSQDDTRFSKNNFAFDLNAAMDSTVVRPLAFARLDVHQTHGGYYPAGGQPFASWGFRTTLDVLTKPVFESLALQGGVRLGYLDLDVDAPADQPFNNNIDAGDFIAELFLGIRWGFLATP